MSGLSQKALIELPLQSSQPAGQEPRTVSGRTGNTGQASSESTYLQQTTCSIFTGRYFDKMSDVLLIKHLQDIVSVTIHTKASTW